MRGCLIMMHRREAHRRRTAVARISHGANHEGNNHADLHARSSSKTSARFGKNLPDFYDMKMWLCLKHVGNFVYGNFEKSYVRGCLTLVDQTCVHGTVL